jgi:D-glycero-alpha-D-manno-heptose 1-phosphate guanylyltransferase
MSAKVYPVIILAGGLGTRLRPVISDLPKPMAPVNGKPFLHYLFQYLTRYEISEAILSVGYRHEAIADFFGNEYLGIKVQYSIEEEPLGTGGAIKKAFELADDCAYVLNGDTFFDVNLNELNAFYIRSNGDIALALKEMVNFDRYGTVSLNGSGRITQFTEKKFLKKGLINGGVYFMEKRIFRQVETAEKFSFEKDVLEKYVGQLNFTGKVFNGYFIDIGIPEDYQRAQSDFG